MRTWSFKVIVALMSGFQMCFMGLLLSMLHLGRKQFLQSMQCPCYYILYSPLSQKKNLKCKTIEAMQTRKKRRTMLVFQQQIQRFQQKAFCVTLCYFWINYEQIFTLKKRTQPHYKLMITVNRRFEYFMMKRAIIGLRSRPKLSLKEWEGAQITVQTRSNKTWATVRIG